MSESQLQSWPRRITRMAASARLFVLIAIYGLILANSFYFSYELRFDFDVPDRHHEDRFEVILWLVPLQMCLLFAFGQFNVLLTYFRLPDLNRIFGALFSVTIFMIAGWYAFQGENMPPRAVILTDFLLAFLSISGFRAALRIFRERYLSEGASTKATEAVVIVGAGEAGASLASELLAKRSLGMRPVAFLDEELGAQELDIHGIPVIGGIDFLANLPRRLGVKKVLVALRPSERERLPHVIRLAGESKLDVEVVPALNELFSGKVRITQLRPVQFEDLLGREPVKLDTTGIGELIQGRVVAVTGAAGSIGSELCRQILSKNPSRLLLIDQNEGALFEVEQELIRAGYGSIIHPALANILDEVRVRGILEDYRPSLLFHAAAHKHVPMMEVQPLEALKNNALGTGRLCRLACETHVERFIYISTDKAVRPTSVMGATKRLGEEIVRAWQERPGNTTRFLSVRFGNVLGSSGSVIPIFKRQIAGGGPVTVTHPDVTRYFMTIPEAVGLVLQSALIGGPGKILVLDMGDPIKILDVARQLIRLSGLEPDVDIPIEFTGLRPGEKLFEELKLAGEEFDETAHSRIRSLDLPEPHCSEADRLLGQLEEHIPEMRPRQVRDWLRTVLSDYQPFPD